MKEGPFQVWNQGVPFVPRGMGSFHPTPRVRPDALRFDSVAAVVLIDEGLEFRITTLQDRRR